MFERNTITHALSNLCRFGGHTSMFYSVAEHSIRVAEILRANRCSPREVALGIIHDASEAYLVDIPRPLKHMPAMKRYRNLESLIERVIWEWAGMEEPNAAEIKAIKWADNLSCQVEAATLLSSNWWNRELVAEWRDVIDIECLPPPAACSRFASAMDRAFFEAGLPDPT